MSDSPLVSVVMPAYDRERYLGRAIASLRAQTFEDFELIVVDDGSRDATAEIAESIDDPRIRVVRNATNLGVSACRNLGLDLARGELVANLDSDDVADPRRLERQVDFFRAHPETALLGTWAWQIDEDDRRLGAIERPWGTDRIRSQLLFRNCFKNTTVMGRRDVLDRYRYREGFHVNEDVDLHVRIALDHPVDNLPECLTSYRSHTESLSQTERRATTLAERAIAASQLDRLGIDHDIKVLRLLHDLRWRRTPRFGRSRLARAEALLLRLSVANRRVGLYPEPLFHRVLCQRWWRACRHSTARPLRRARMWATSPLARGLGGAAWDAARTRLRGRPAW
ncbi:MAG: glycosyltransferase family 2 protein [Myxococcota bacterium]